MGVWRHDYRYVFQVFFYILSEDDISSGVSRCWTLSRTHPTPSSWVVRTARITYGALRKLTLTQVSMFILCSPPKRQHHGGCWVNCWHKTKTFQPFIYLHLLFKKSALKRSAPIQPFTSCISNKNFSIVAWEDPICCKKYILHVWSIYQFCYNNKRRLTPPKYSW